MNNPIIKAINENLAKNGYSPNILNSGVISYISDMAMTLLNLEPLNQDDVNNLADLLWFCNFLYNNTDMDPLPVEDGVYDLLLEKYKKYNPNNYQVGATPPQQFSITGNFTKENTPKEIVRVFSRPDERLDEHPIFENEIIKKYPAFTMEDFITRPFIETDRLNIGKRLRNTAHGYPELVGTLDKTKFVMNFQAKERGVFEDSNVKIFERDFMQPVIDAGLLDPNKEFTMVAELKYDGISIEADIENGVITGARSRGDTGTDEASDLTPILGGYKFRHATDPRLPKKFGMKFEAVITYLNLSRLNRIFGKTYKNPRNAIIGIFGSNDALYYQDYITLVPLGTSLHGINRIEELEFMNKYYHSGELCRYAVITGNYYEVMYLINKFTEEAEYCRGILPCMYDGVVISFLDQRIRDALGRKNSVNKYSCAIKFNPMSKLTRFIGYSYTVGQTGVIIPMIHYAPIEFYGMVQNKSSAHSYKRFLDLGLRVNDIIRAEYTNDVMTYIDKPDIEENANNPNPIVEFIHKCPECGSELVVADSGNNVYCMNIQCPGRRVARMVNMLKKLNFKNIAEETVKAIDIYTFREFMELAPTYLESKGIGPITINNIYSQIISFKSEPVFDYRCMGSLGFSGLADRWKLILSVIPLEYIIELNNEDLIFQLSSIPKIGNGLINVIIAERGMFMDDIIYISKMPNLKISYGYKPTGKVIRFSGVRDYELMQKLIDMGHDASDGAVTKNTNILIVPYAGYVSTKVNKLDPNAQVVPINEFRSNPDRYLQ